MDVVDAFHRHKLALALDQIFQKVDRDRVESREVTFAVDRDERINLCVNGQPVEKLLTSLAAEFGGEGRARHRMALLLVDLMRLHCVLKDIYDKNSAIASYQRAELD